MSGSGKERWRLRSADWGWAASVSNNCAAIASTCCASSFTLRLLKAGATIVRNRACSPPSCETSHPGEPRITESGVNAALSKRRKGGS
ncbi:hypothetical protein MesoLjLb_67070 [Mesorhizobium sp. L-8-3]|nr:hypothetical protein MesoLjLb_67070 [Mesorhizobium sp. L-8-3]